MRKRALFALAADRSLAPRRRSRAVELEHARAAERRGRDSADEPSAAGRLQGHYDEPAPSTLLRRGTTSNRLPAARWRHPDAAHMAKLPRARASRPPFGDGPRLAARRPLAEGTTATRRRLLSQRVDDRKRPRRPQLIGRRRRRLHRHRCRALRTAREGLSARARSEYIVGARTATRASSTASTCSKLFAARYEQLWVIARETRAPRGVDPCAEVKEPDAVDGIADGSSGSKYSRIWRFHSDGTDVNCARARRRQRARRHSPRPVEPAAAGPRPSAAAVNQRTSATRLRRPTSTSSGRAPRRRARRFRWCYMGTGGGYGELVGVARGRRAASRPSPPRRGRRRTLRPSAAALVKQLRTRRARARSRAAPEVRPRAEVRIVASTTSGSSARRYLGVA